MVENKSFNGSCAIAAILGHPKWVTLSSDILAAVCTITPEGAKWAMELPVEKQRKLKPIVVDRYARDMTTGKWKLTAQPIIFSNAGTLLDGQHRINACLRANVPFSTLVIYGPSLNISDCIDTGIVRTFPDVLGVHGEKNTALTSSIISNVCRYLRGVPGYTTLKVSIPEMLKTLDLHPEIRSSAELVVKNKMPGISGGIVGAIHYLASRGQNEKATEFVLRLANGSELSVGNPILALRNLALTNIWRSYSVSAKYGCIVRAWNAFCANKIVKVMRQQQGVPLIFGAPHIKQENGDAIQFDTEL